MKHFITQLRRFVAPLFILMFTAVAQPRVEFRDAPFYRFPGITRLDKKNAIDCNSPAVWVGSTFYLFNSYGQPARGTAKNLLAVKSMTLTPMDGEIDGMRLNDLYIWLESVWMDPRGVLYGWYHYEPDNVCKPGAHLPTAPRIGALRSRDQGATWEHLGIVIDPPPGSFRCDTPSPWDAGGHGDFSVIADREQEHLYFFFSSYVKNMGQQGVAVARMRVSDRDSPVGNVFRWHNSGWSQPGIAGLHTPIWPPKIDWHRPDADLFWGPSVHWNTHLESFVILMSRAVNTGMKGDGTWVSFNADLANPGGWSEPHQVLTPAQTKLAAKGANKGNAQNFGWYPQVIGTGHGESDRLAGKVARYFVAGVSRKEIVFLKEGENR